MTKSSPDEKINRVLELRRKFESKSTEHTAREWITAENELTAEEFEEYMAKWRNDE